MVQSGMDIPALNWDQQMCIRDRFLGIHTPADLLGERAVEAKVAEVMAEKENPTVKDLMDRILSLIHI